MDNSLARQLHLRDAVLEVFVRPRIVRNAHEEPTLIGFTRDEVHEMIRSCAFAGFLVALEGEGPGTIYQITQDGEINLELSKRFPVVNQQ